MRVPTVRELSPLGEIKQASDSSANGRKIIHI